MMSLITYQVIQEFTKRYKSQNKASVSVKNAKIAFLHIVLLHILLTQCLNPSLWSVLSKFKDSNPDLRKDDLVTTFPECDTDSWCFFASCVRPFISLSQHLLSVGCQAPSEASRTASHSILTPSK
jgi:hypothetical protein